MLNTQRTEALLSTIDQHIAAVAALKAERDELHKQDRLKTREINVLVAENRAVIVERDELQKLVVEACPLISVIGTTDAERTDVIRRAEAWLASVVNTTRR